MKLAVLCDTAINYIGEIEIGRRFPSLPLIEKISAALGISPYRFFMEEDMANNPEIEDAIKMLSNLSPAAKLIAINKISGGVEASCPSPSP